METELQRQLEESGYSFTGIYDFFKDNVKERADELRKEGYFVRVIFVPGSKHSRGGGGGGYSAYSKPKPEKIKELELQKIDEKKRLKTQIRTTEIEIIDWAKLIVECRPNSTRLECRIYGIDNMIQVRKEILLKVGKI